MKNSRDVLILYIEMNSGVAGDMLVASLLDLFDDLEFAKTQLINILVKVVNKSEVNLVCEKITTGSIESLKIDFKTPEDDWSKHPHEDKHSHVHRNFSTIKKLISESSLSQWVKQKSVEAFEILARAEAKVHGVDYQKVHFHEVGSLDAILEVCSFFILLEMLKVKDVYASSVYIGCGSVECAHGRMPVPVPAVAEMLATHKVPFRKANHETGELTTPTGLAILLSVCQGFSFPNLINTVNQIKKNGYGAGHKKILKFTNVLRTSLINISTLNQCNSPHQFNQVVEIKVNIDDMNGEEIAQLVRKLFAQHALDVVQYPVYMKKGRPGLVLEILCEDSDRPQIGELLFMHSSSIGYRYQHLARETLPREEIIIVFQGMNFRAKKVSLKNYHRIKIEDESLIKGLEKFSFSRKELEAKVLQTYQQSIF